MTSAMANWSIQPRTAWRICLGAGLVILLLNFMSGPQAQPCGGLAKNYTPIVAFELARNAADLQLIFGSPDSACHQDMIRSMDSINWVDVLVLIPAYGTLLICFFLGARKWNAALANIGVKLVIVAIVTDYVENLCLMQLTPQLDATSVWMSLLPWATGAKWLALAAAAAVAGVIFISIRPPKYLIAAAPAALVCWLALPATIAAVAEPTRFGPILSPAIGATWIIFLLTAITQVWRSLRQPAR